MPCRFVPLPLPLLLTGRAQFSLQPSFSFHRSLNTPKDRPKLLLCQVLRAAKAASDQFFGTALTSATVEGNFYNLVPFCITASISISLLYGVELNDKLVSPWLKAAGASMGEMMHGTR